MTPHEARSVQLVAKWLSMRDAVKAHYGIHYARYLGMARRVLECRRRKTGEDEVHAAMAAFKEADDNGEGMIAALYVATLVDDDPAPDVPARDEKGEGK